jgi:hypothetical protein
VIRCIGDDIESKPSTNSIEEEVQMKRAFEYADELKARSELIMKSSKSFEGLETYRTLVDNSHLILRDNFSAQHCELLNNTPIMFLMANDLDACALKVPNTNNESVIAIGPRFSMLLHLMVRASLWVGNNFGKIDAKVFQGMARSASAIFAYFAVQRPFKNELYQDWFSGDSAETDVLYGTLCFALCHELAHIKLGHLANCGVDNLEDALTYFRYVQRQEFDADLEGTGLYYEGCPEIRFRGASPLIVCYTIALLDCFKQISLPQNSQMSTHPHGMERASQLLQRFKPIMSGGETTYAFFMCSVVEGIIKELKNTDLRDIFIGKKLNFSYGLPSYPTLDLFYQIQKKQK